MMFKPSNEIDLVAYFIDPIFMRNRHGGKPSGLSERYRKQQYAEARAKALRLLEALEKFRAENSIQTQRGNATDEITGLETAILTEAADRGKSGLPADIRFRDAIEAAVALQRRGYVALCIYITPAGQVALDSMEVEP